MSEGSYRGVPWADIEAVVRAAGLRNGVPYRDMADHAQDAIERLLGTRGPRSNDRRTVLAYAWKVGAFTAKDRARASQCRPETVPLLLHDEDPWLRTRERGFDAVDALDLVRRLHRRDREALMVAFLFGDGGPSGLAGDVLGVSDAAAYQRISRARRAARLAA